MKLAELQRIGQWHVAHRADHPVEYHSCPPFATRSCRAALHWRSSLVK
jgi:hypothetical protein